MAQKNILKQNNSLKINKNISKYYIEDDDTDDNLTPELINVDNPDINNQNKKSPKSNNKNDLNKSQNEKKDGTKTQEIVIEINIDSINDEDLDFIDDDFEYIEEDSDTNTDEN